MTTEHQASRTLVKSPPELWAECSDADALARHMNESFGEIRITRLEPETSVAWEGDHASGTVRIEPSGWGTRVTLTAQTSVEEVVEDGACPTVDEAAHPEAAVSDGAGTAIQETPDAVITDDDSGEEEADAMVEEAVAKPDLVLAPDSGPAGGRWKRLMGRARAWFMPTLDELDQAPVPIVDPDALTAAVPELEPPEPPAPLAAADGEAAFDAESILVAALDSMGRAHHRPFSRA